MDFSTPNIIWDILYIEILVMHLSSVHFQLYHVYKKYMICRNLTKTVMNYTHSIVKCCKLFCRYNYDHVTHFASNTRHKTKTNSSAFQLLLYDVITSLAKKFRLKLISGSVAMFIAAILIEFTALKYQNLYKLMLNWYQYVRYRGYVYCRNLIKFTALKYQININRC